MSVDKAQARKAAFARRKLAHQAGHDMAAQAALRQVLMPYAGQVLAGYMPIRTEVDPLPVMAGWSGAVCVPVIRGEGQRLSFHLWTPDCEMVEGPFGAAVPADPQPVEPQVVLVPLVAFDARGYRLGYGGGFYDRTLQDLRSTQEVVAIGYAYGAQQTDTVPLEPTDQRLDAMVTEEGVTWFS